MTCPTGDAAERSAPASPIATPQGVRERIAEAIRDRLSRSDTKHLKPVEALWAADAVLKTLGLEQVGFAYGGFLVRAEQPDAPFKGEPVYRLRPSSPDPSEPGRPDERAVHQGRLRLTSDSGWEPRCICGWKGQPRWSDLNAKADLAQHHDPGGQP